MSARWPPAGSPCPRVEQWASLPLGHGRMMMSIEQWACLPWFCTGEWGKSLDGTCTVFWARRQDDHCVGGASSLTVFGRHNIVLCIVQNQHLAILTKDLNTTCSSSANSLKKRLTKDNLARAFFFSKCMRVFSWRCLGFAELILIFHCLDISLIYITW